MEASIRPLAVVTGLESIAGLQSARILARRGVPVIGIADDRRSAFSRTRVCERVLIAPHDSLVATLCALGPTLHGRRAMIVPSTDREVLELLQHRDKLQNWFEVALPAHDVVHTLMNKARFLQFALDNDLPVPTTVHLDERAHAVAAARALRYPAVIKPPIRDLGWSVHTKAKAFKVANAPEFMAVYDRVARWTDRLIAQEWIAGGEDQLFSCNAYFDVASQPLVTFVSRKLRQWPPETGMSALAEECRNDEVRDITVRLFSTAGFSGLAYLEVKRDVRDGRHYIVEPNVGRATGRSAIAEAGGVDILLTAYCDVMGLPLPDTREQRYTGVKWIYLRWDLQAALANLRSGDLTPAQWWNSLRGPRAYAAFDRTDPLPFVLDFARQFERLARRAQR